MRTSDFSIRNCVVYLSMVLLIFCACGKSSYYKIGYDDSLWMLYDDGQEIYFQHTGSTDIDTIYFYGKSKGYVQEGDTYEEFMSIKFRIKRDTVPMAREGQLRLSNTKDGFNVNIKVPHHPQEIVPQYLLPLPAVVINNIPYSSVYVSQANPLLLNQISRVNRVWYNMDAGLLKYTDIAGNEWELIP